MRRQARINTERLQLVLGNFQEIIPHVFPEQDTLVGSDVATSDGRVSIIPETQLHSSVDTVVTEDYNSDAYLSSELAQWALEHNVTQVCLSKLLKIIKVHCGNNSLPNDARTLLKSPRNVFVRNISGGDYCHIGLKISCQGY